MPKLISGSTLRRGGSGDFIDLAGAMPQLPATDTTTTGFTLVTDELLRTSYRSSLGHIEFYTASMYSSLPEGIVRVLATGSSFSSISTDTGTLVVEGGIGVGANMTVRDDITVNSLLIGQGFSDPEYGAYNNIVIRGTATTTINDFSNGQNSIAIGYDTLVNLNTAYKSIAIGRNALGTGTGIRNSIAIGDSALKENGVTYDRFILPITGVTSLNNRPITNITNSLPAVATVVGHGLTTGSRISIEGVVGISSGIFSLVNGQSFYVDPLTADTIALYNYDNFGPTTALDTRPGTSTVYESSGTLIYPLEISVPNNDYTTGTAVQLTNLFDGLEEIDNFIFYTLPLGNDVFQLYKDKILSEGLDGTDLTPYVSGGTSTRVLLSANNIAIGTNAGKSLYDGERNFFLGDYIAQNLTTGSYNFFIGHEVGNNLTHGNSNVSIMGDNLIDGRDNQVNIGGVFYYNGAGYLQLNADTGLGLGTTATTTGSGALAVLGGISVSENIITNGPVEIRSNQESTSASTGALIVTGGVGIGGRLYAGGRIYAGDYVETFNYMTTATTGKFADRSINLIDTQANIKVARVSDRLGPSYELLAVTTSGSVRSYWDIVSSSNVDGLDDLAIRWRTTDVTNTSSNRIYIYGADGVKSTGTVWLSTPIPTQNTESGSLVVAGGVGIGGDVYAGGSVSAASVAIDATLQDYATITTTSTAQSSLASFSAAEYGCGEFIIQATQGAARHVTKILVVHDGTTANSTEYGVIVTDVSLFTAEVDISDGDVRLLITPTSETSTVFRTSYTLIGS